MMPGPSSLEQLFDWPTDVTKTLFESPGGMERLSRVQLLAERELVTASRYCGKATQESPLKWYEKSLAQDFKKVIVKDYASLALIKSLFNLIKVTSQ